MTGFEPYGGGGANPSAEVATRLDGREIDGARVVGRTMPVRVRDLGQRIEDLMAELDPVAVVSLGLWPGEPMIRLERVAPNVADFAIPDNEGALLQDAPCLLKLDPLILPGRIGVHCSYERRPTSV